MLGDELEDAGPVTKLVLADGVGEVVNERTEVGVKDCELAVVVDLAGGCLFVLLGTLWLWSYIRCIPLPL